MTNYVGVVPPYYSGIVNSLNAYAIFKYAVFLMNEASFKHGEREALRSCIKALNFWATEICWELQDFTLNKLKGIEDELIINMSAKSSFRILNLLSFCLGELQDFVLNKSKEIEDELIIKLKSAIIEVADGDGDDEYSLLVDLNRFVLFFQNNGGCFRKATLASTELEALGSSSHLTVVWRNIKRAKTTPHLCKLVIIAVGKLVAADAVPKAADGARIVGASRIIGVDLNASRFEQAKQLIHPFYFYSTTKKFGVTQFVNPKDYSKPVQEVIAEMTDGVDRSVECTGHIDAMIPAFECVHDGWGVAVLVGAIRKLCCVVFSEQWWWLFRKATLASSTELEALGYSPDESIHQKFKKLCERQLNITGGLSCPIQCFLFIGRSSSSYLTVV
ncbi:hypothetical protein MTR67_023594 [Solanum verrucosum]|uniref:alcohol dehydrogenase n=1 Tax=Solanum verrucosum TaxID=315347 RepID=A0AAF0QTR7_SOLVR|nr:hypothetical protein MTR67_023594 [Solanum verrucosum]